MVEWNSSQYLKFKKERTQPSIDLANRLDMPEPQRILDIGCGPGNSTEVLQRRFPRAQLTGIDNSDDMIRQARESHPGIVFEQMDASGDLSRLGVFDIVFSNACIQWIPDHQNLLRNFMARLRPGGMLAVQTPMIYQEPIHVAVNSIVNSDRWKAFFPVSRPFHNLGQDGYFHLLRDIAADVTIWQTTYCHIMPNHEAILEWYKGAGLRPYLAVLEEAARVRFETEILEELRKVYPLQKSGEIIFRFPRFFFTATAR